MSDGLIVDRVPDEIQDYLEQIAEQVRRDLAERMEMTVSRRLSYAEYLQMRDSVPTAWARGHTAIYRFDLVNTSAKRLAEQFGMVASDLERMFQSLTSQRKITSFIGPFVELSVVNTQIHFSLWFAHEVRFP
jgi:hypothetical protein